MHVKPLTCYSCIVHEEAKEKEMDPEEIFKRDDISSEGRIAHHDGFYETGEPYVYRTDQPYGGRIPAVPCDGDCSVMWGYSSVPEDMCKWWANLPNY